MPQDGVLAACNHCGGPGTQRCSACQQVAYCSRAHQQADWKSHKPACLYYRKNKSEPGELDSHIPKDGYVGTLRWGPDTKFMELPAFHSKMTPPITGWQDYFAIRLEGASENEEGKTVLEPPMLDGLSFPMTFLWAVKQMLVMTAITLEELLGRKKLVIAALGASDRAEERLLHHSNYWQEIEHLLGHRNIELWLVGPEMAKITHEKEFKLRKSMTAFCLRGTTSDFLNRRAADDPILVGFNTGFGSGDKALRESWTGELQRILSLGLLSIFTCANDHSDLKGEREVMEAGLKAKYMLYPRRSPFSAITTTHLPGRQEDTWACANSFVYAVKGFDAGGMEKAVRAPAAAAVPGSSDSRGVAPDSDEENLPRRGGAAAASHGPTNSSGEAEAGTIAADAYDIEELD